MFKGKTVVITGAAVGIGRAAAIKFLNKGAKVAVLDLNEEKLNSLKEEIKDYEDHFLVYGCDVSDEQMVKNVFADIFRKFGHIDILVNNAALWRNWSSMEMTSTETWRKYFDINVLGTVYCIDEVIKQMKTQHYGRIINIASVAGVYGNANMVCYSATKGAVISMTKALAKEIAEFGITVNSISPGSVSPSENDDPDYYETSELSFMGRTGTDNENADLICFLAGDEAAYISGQNIQIDGCRKKM